MLVALDAFWSAVSEYCGDASDFYFVSPYRLTTESFATESIDG